MKIKLTPSQQKVFDQLIHFIENDEFDTFILKGYAGTGKTLLIQEFARYLEQKERRFMLLATTGRAAAVLRGKTELPTSTIHGALYSFSRVDGDDENIPENAPADSYGQMLLVFEPNKNLHEECIYIVDEASMLASESKNDTSYAIFGSGDLLPDLLNAIEKNKIIFVGDDAQLPPVSQEISPALDQKWLTRNGRKTILASLTEIMRTAADNDILQMAQEIRESIGKFHIGDPIKLPARNRKNCNVLPTANTVFLEYYVHFLQFGPDKTIAIAPSNKACNHINIFFRKRLFNNPSSTLEVGEIIMVTQNNYIVPLTNGDFVKILDLGEKSHRANLHFQNIRIQHLTTKKEFEIKIALDPFTSLSPNLSRDQQRNLMIDFSRRMKKNGIRVGSSAFNEAMQKDPFLNSLRGTYGYVVTCHKAQGGEWENVFLFLDDKMYYYMNENYMRRWWYTAITRTINNLYIHNAGWIE